MQLIYYLFTITTFYLLSIIYFILYYIIYQKRKRAPLLGHPRLCPLLRASARWHGPSRGSTEEGCSSTCFFSTGQILTSTETSPNNLQICEKAQCIRGS